MPHRRTFLLGPALAVPAAALAIAGCGGYGGGARVAGAAAPAAAAGHHGARAVVAVRGTSLGRILVDGHGRTLYRFAKDTGSHSACFGACARVWPPLRTTGAPRAGAGIIASSLGSSRRADGARGVTYAGHPLYAYAGDHAAGDTNGDGLDAFGGRWSVVPAAGGRARAAATSASTPSGY
jgi:predicted lipoprotein with Yx(FWY)xxD motif